MKYLSFILLFFISCAPSKYITVYSQITLQHHLTAGPSSVNAGSYTLIGAPITAGTMYLVVTQVTGTNTPGTLTSPSNTFLKVGSVADLNGRIEAFICLAKTTSSDTLTYSGFGGGGTGSVRSLYSITGAAVSENGTAMVRQAVSNSGTGANPTVTLPSLSPENSVLVLAMSDLNPFTGTAPAGWTEQRDGGWTTPTTGVYQMFRNNNTDKTITITAASTTWLVLALELRPAVKRVYLTKADTNKNNWTR